MPGNPPANNDIPTNPPAAPAQTAPVTPAVPKKKPGGDIIKSKKPT